MKATIAALLVTAAMCAPVGANEQQDVAASAKSFYSGATWQPKSVVHGDFSCHGHREVAILGTNSKVIVVAIFVHGLSKKPSILEYSAKLRKPESAVLTTESLDIDPGDSDTGEVPEDMRPSKTCLALNLSDSEIDSAHIYWSHKYKRFSDWTL